MNPFYADDSVTVYAGDCLDVMRGLPDASVDAVVTDPPYLLGFMGKGWDTRAAQEHLDWHRAWCDEAFRLLKPGGHLLAFGGTRTYHRLACAVEDAGFEVRDSIAWLYGSGFPKSLDVSKAIDKAAGAEREVIGERTYVGGHTQRSSAPRFNGAAYANGAVYSEAPMRHDTAPATDAARDWDGWGTALKPAHEPIVVARKSLTGTVAQNWLDHGTGALNIDGCRIGLSGGGGNGLGSHYDRLGDTEPRVKFGDDQTGSVGRWPTNVLLDQSQADALDAETGVLTPSRDYIRRSDTNTGVTGWNSEEAGTTVGGYGDSGGASRFFPTFRYEAKASTDERPSVDGVLHPTVKPLDLMRWLVRLVTPRGGIVLEPFLGSGTTAEACVLENLRCIGIEREAAYLPLTVARLSKPLQVGFDFGETA